MLRTALTHWQKCQWMHDDRVNQGQELEQSHQHMLQLSRSGQKLPAATKLRLKHMAGASPQRKQSLEADNMHLAKPQAPPQSSCLRMH
jgi:hypothetical protein